MRSYLIIFVFLIFGSILNTHASVPSKAVVLVTFSRHISLKYKLVSVGENGQVKLAAQHEQQLDFCRTLMYDLGSDHSIESVPELSNLQIVSDEKGTESRSFDFSSGTEPGFDEVILIKDESAELYGSPYLIEWKRERYPSADMERLAAVSEAQGLGKLLFKTSDWNLRIPVFFRNGNWNAVMDGKEFELEFSHEGSVRYLRAQEANFNAIFSPIIRTMELAMRSQFSRFKLTQPVFKSTFTEGGPTLRFNGQEYSFYARKNLVVGQYAYDIGE